MTDKKSSNASALRGRSGSEKSRRPIAKATISLMESICSLETDQGHRVSITRAMKAPKNAGKIILEDRRLILPALNIA
jgi:hypothetical protein